MAVTWMPVPDLPSEQRRPGPLDDSEALAVFPSERETGKSRVDGAPVPRAAGMRMRVAPMTRAVAAALMAILIAGVTCIVLITRVATSEAAAGRAVPSPATVSASR